MSQLTVQHIQSSKYLFHLHTNFTDGSLSVEDYFIFARKQGYNLLLFLEHVKKRVSYDTKEYAQQIKKFSEQYRIDARVGFETKLNADGSLDINAEDYKSADVLGVAVHKFSDDIYLLMKAFAAAILRYKDDDKLFVWIHPGMWFVQRNLLEVKSLMYMESVIR